MKTEIVEFENWHGSEIANRNKEDGLIVPSKSVNLDDLLKLWREGGPSYTMLIDNVPVCCAGIVLMGWNRGEAWTFPSKLFYSHIKECFKGIKRNLERLAEEHRLVRVQSLIDPLFEWGDGWMKHLGFQCEGTLRKFGCNGEDLKMYSRIFNVSRMEGVE